MTDPTLIETGLQAWADGDLDALEAILDPQASLRAVQAGPWDCVGRDQIMRLLRQRQADRHGVPLRPVQLDRLDEHTYIVTSHRRAETDHPSNAHVATKVTVDNGKVTAMQQFLAHR